jgi:hypothetical protein
VVSNFLKKTIFNFCVFTVRTSVLVDSPCPVEKEEEKEVERLSLVTRFSTI